MGRKKRTDLPIPENEQLRYTEKEPLAAKIKKVNLFNRSYPKTI